MECSGPARVVFVELCRVRACGRQHGGYGEVKRGCDVVQVQPSVHEIVALRVGASCVVSSRRVSGVRGACFAEKAAWSDRGNGSQPWTSGSSEWAQRRGGGGLPNL
jgi:hypothetical protein